MTEVVCIRVLGASTHRLHACAINDEELNAHARTEQLIALYEHHCIPGKRLPLFEGQSKWSIGSLKFSLIGEKMPEFGQFASEVCPNTPIVYYTDNINYFRAKDPMYFLNGKRVWLNSIPRKTAEIFKTMVDTKGGIHQTCAPGTLEKFFL